MNQENKNETVFVPETEVAEVKKLTEKRKNRGMAVIALAASLFGFGAAKGVEAAPQIIDNATSTIQEAVAPVADIFHETNESDLTGTIAEQVPAGGTIEELAVEADPSVDPRIIESALKDRGVTPDTIQPGQIIDVPVTPQAKAAHDEETHN